MALHRLDIRLGGIAPSLSKRTKTRRLAALAACKPLHQSAHLLFFELIFDGLVNDDQIRQQELEAVTRFGFSAGMDICLFHRRWSGTLEAKPHTNT